MVFNRPYLLDHPTIVMNSQLTRFLSYNTRSGGAWTLTCRPSKSQLPWIMLMHHNGHDCLDTSPVAMAGRKKTPVLCYNHIWVHSHGICHHQLGQHSWANWTTSWSCQCPSCLVNKMLHRGQTRKHSCQVSKAENHYRLKWIRLYIRMFQLHDPICGWTTHEHLLRNDEPKQALNHLSSNVVNYWIQWMYQWWNIKFLLDINYHETCQLFFSGSE